MSTIYAGRPASAWKSIDYEALERSWQEDDAKDELRTEGDILYAETQRQRASAEMIFVTLKPNIDQTIADLTSIWKEMLAYSSSIEINCYKIEKNKILIGIQRGWHAKEVETFLSQQPEIQLIEWKKNTAAGLNDEL